MSPVPPQSPDTPVLAFKAETLVSAGALADVAQHLKSLLNQGHSNEYLLFERTTGLQFDIELGLTDEQLARRYGEATSTKGNGTQVEAAGEGSSKPRGRPKLGVVGREVTLLPRHWEWLDRQRGGASAVLRRLIEAQRKENAGAERQREAQDSTNRFIYAMAGNLPGFEEAVRALYAGDKQGFSHQIRQWPADIKKCTLEFAGPAFAEI